MNEKNQSSSISTAIILSILTYFFITVFQEFGIVMNTTENPAPVILTLIALGSLGLISICFILIAIGKTKFQKIVMVLTIIVIIIFLFLLILNFLGFAGLDLA